MKNQRLRTGTGTEIAKMMKDDDTKIVKSSISEFSCGRLMRSLGIRIGRYGPVDYC